MHDAEPVAPSLHDPATTAPETGKPLFVTAIVTFAVHVDPLFVLEPERATARPPLDELTVTLRDVLPVAESSSVTVSVTV